MRLFFTICFLLTGGYSLMASWEDFPDKRSKNRAFSGAGELVFEHLKVKNIEMLNDFPLPSSLGIIFDLDGTLTKERDPGAANKVTANGDVPSTIKFLEDQKVSFMISSAWNKFSETLERLNALGLIDYIGPQYSKIEPHVPEATHIDGQYITYQEAFIDEGLASLRNIYGVTQKVSYKNYISNGVNVASVCLDSINWGTTTYYRQKALAPLWTNARKAFEKVEEIWFFDDSKLNIEFFKDDIKMFKNHYPVLKRVKIFQVKAK